MRYLVFSHNETEITQTEELSDELLEEAVNGDVTVVNERGEKLDPSCGAFLPVPRWEM